MLTVMHFLFAIQYLIIIVTIINILLAVRKIEYSLYKLYLVTAYQNTGSVKNDKVAEFLSKMLPELQGQSEWRDWFSSYSLNC